MLSWSAASSYRSRRLLSSTSSGKAGNTDPISSLLIWLILAVIGVMAGTVGATRIGKMDMGAKRIGYLISSVAFLFVLVNTNTLSETADVSVVVLAGIAIILWLCWMFFSGAVRWTSNRIIIGLLLLTFLWMQSWTLVDRWSIIYFVIWLAAGVVAFKRGEAAQADKRLALGAESGRLFHRYPMPGDVCVGSCLARRAVNCSEYHYWSGCRRASCRHRPMSCCPFPINGFGAA